jgi:putative ABC transport system substrate-binding protein
VTTRRAFLGSTAGGLWAASRAVSAQRPRRALRLGILVSGFDRNGRLLKQLLQGLRDLGYIENDSLTIVIRDVEGHQERFPAMAAELVALAPDVILASSTPAARAAKQATATIPILFVGDPDPVASGLVQSLARPGGNVTGISNLGNELLGKRLELLAFAAPAARRVAFLWQRGVFPERVESGIETRASEEARALGLALHFVESDGTDLDRAFGRIASARDDALLVTNPSPVLFGERKRIAELAGARRLPSMFNVREFVVDGGLMSYGPDFAASFRRMATYIDRIARGAKAAELSVERATTLELVINTRTAAAIGLVLQPSLLARADDVIR